MLTAYEILWLFAFPSSMSSWYHTIRRAGTYIRATRELSVDSQPRIIFSLTARKLIPIIEDCVDSVNKSSAQVGFSNYEIKLVVDQADTNLDGVDTILVPKDFTSRSRYKARALHYALRYLPNSRDIWILHLDEDARITAQCVNKIVHYISENGNPIANGPSVFPYDGNIFTFYAEAQRQSNEKYPTAKEVMPDEMLYFSRRFCHQAFSHYSK